MIQILHERNSFDLLEQLAHVKFAEFDMLRDLIQLDRFLVVRFKIFADRLDEFELFG
ncbi:hypothetical protein D1872_345340 [compost metagenome]